MIPVQDIYRRVYSEVPQSNQPIHIRRLLRLFRRQRWAQPHLSERIPARQRRKYEGSRCATMRSRLHALIARRDSASTCLDRMNVIARGSNAKLAVHTLYQHQTYCIQKSKSTERTLRALTWGGAEHAQLRLSVLVQPGRSPTSRTTVHRAAVRGNLSTFEDD